MPLIRRKKENQSDTFDHDDDAEFDEHGDWHHHSNVESHQHDNSRKPEDDDAFYVNEFAPTPKISTYLIAIVCGDLYYQVTIIMFIIVWKSNMCVFFSKKKIERFVMLVICLFEFGQFLVQKLVLQLGKILSFYFFKKKFWSKI